MEDQISMSFMTNYVAFVGLGNEICQRNLYSWSSDSRTPLETIDPYLFRYLIKKQSCQNSTMLPVCVSWEMKNSFTLRLGTWHTLTIWPCWQAISPWLVISSENSLPHRSSFQ